MILKLRITKFGEEVAWMLKDNIQQIHHKYINEPKNMNKFKEAGILYINTYPKIDDPKAIKQILEISIRYENKFFETIFTDDLVYIMNNEGKTIDMIHD